jgi:uncharacterized membrane protein (Fun14 family)
MQLILPPSFSTTFLVSIVAPFIIGFVVGIIIKSALKIGLALLFLVIVLIALGILSPNQVLGWAVALIKSGASISAKAEQIAGYLPYSSITFLLGAALGFFKG